MTPEEAAVLRRSWLGTAVSAGLAGLVMLVLAHGPITSYLDTASALVLAAAVVIGAVGVRRPERAARPAVLAVSILGVVAAVIVSVGFFVTR
jgi:hypothetical protein